LPSALFFGLALAVLFLWLSDAYGALAGLAATVVLGLMPRFFSYSALLALDAPLASLTLAATYVYWKTIDRPGWRWAIPFGLVWGLALTAKNGGWLLPVGLGVWTLVYYRTWRRLTRLAVAGAIAVLVFVVSWPWLYPDVVDRLAGFIRFSFLGHSSLLEQHTYYLGQLYQKPPWHYPFVIAGLVLPVTTLLMLIAGLAAVMGEGRAARTGWLLVLSMLGPMLPFAAGLVAAYDGERLFLSSFPFMAALAGLGFVRTAEAVWRLLWRRLPRLTARRQSTMVRHAVAAGLLCVVAALPLVSIIRLQPYGLAYYSELAGGVPGAARIGLETTFWGDSYQGLLGYLNEQAGPKATVWADAYYILWAYQDIGRLRKDIIVPGADAPDPLSADFAIVQARQSRYFTPVLAIMTAQRPEAVVQVDGVPLAFVYRIAR
jgi:4-amino-4-deoxy-L-arabinose transferase-like glycosyltransferase